MAVHVSRALCVIDDLVTITHYVLGSTFLLLLEPRHGFCCNAGGY